MNFIFHRSQSSQAANRTKPFAIHKLISILILSALLVSCAAPAVQPTSLAVEETETPVANTPSLSAAAATSTPALLPTPTLTLAPTLDPEVIAQEKLNQEIFTLMLNFDDGQGLVNSYDLASISAEDYDKLSGDEQVAFKSEKMIDQAYAVLTYIKIGKMEDARRVLSAMQDMVNGDMAPYVDQAGGGRSIGWWNIAVQQYYLLDPDPTLIDFMQWVDYKGYWRQPDYYTDVFEQRITGEQPDFWENETNIETLVQTMFYLKLDEKYGLDTIYGVNVEGYNLEEQRNLIGQRFNALADSLKQILYSGDENGRYLIEGYTLTETYTNAVILAGLLEREYPEQFMIADVDTDEILEKIETDYSLSVEENGKQYHLYRAANDADTLPSFVTSLQVANAYLAAADAFDYRKANPDQVQGYMDKDLSYVRVDDEKAAEYRQRAETILAEVWEYTNFFEYSSIPYIEKNSQLYLRYGPYVFEYPAMSALAQYVQCEKGTFFFPETASPVVANGDTSLTPTAEADLGTQYTFYKSFNSMDDEELLTLRAELHANKMDYLLETVWVGDQVEYRLYLKPDNPHFNP